MTTSQTAAVAQHGQVQDIALNRLKASPKNVRRVGHPAEVIEERAASIKAKGVIQPLVVEPETKDGQATGYYLVSVGEGRRQALRLLAKRKVLSRTAPVRCVVDTVNDPAEVSLDENISRESMHPADQYEAFKDLAERKGWSAEEISARFGPSPETVRQRLRLGAVAPALLDIYREGGLNLEQIVAFAVNPDPERQMQVYAQLPEHQREPRAIRRAMTDAKVAATERRAVFVGLDAYVAAGGPVLRDLFTQEGEGWLEDVVLLDRLVAEKLSAIAEAVRDDEGWKWSEAYLDFPHGLGCSRVFERRRQRSAEDREAIAALYDEDNALTEQWAEIDPPPPEVAARFEEIEAALEAYGDDVAFDPEEKARAGVVVWLPSDGEARIERGFVRVEDELAPEPDPEPEAEDEADEGIGDDDDQDDEADEARADASEVEEEIVPDATAPLSPRIQGDLTAHRSAALRCVLAENPDMALVALVHVLALRVFGRGSPIPSCLDVRMGSRTLPNDGEGIEDSRAGLANAERHAAWARQMPEDPTRYWSFIVELDGDSRLSLLAHCLSLTVDAVHNWERRPGVWLHADQLAAALDLDMRDWWSPTRRRYLDAVTKAHILGAVAEASKPEDALRMAKLKKEQMIEIAEPALVAARWLPPLLRNPLAVGVEQPRETADPAGALGDGEAIEGERADPALAQSALGEATSEDEALSVALGAPEIDDQPPLSALGEAVSDMAAPSDEDEAEVAAMLTAAE